MCVLFESKQLEIQLELSTTSLEQYNFTTTGKGVSIWDTHVHEGGHVFMNATGDVADDSYHKYMDDVEIISNLGVSTRRTNRL